MGLKSFKKDVQEIEKSILKLKTIFDKAVSEATISSDGKMQLTPDLIVCLKENHTVVRGRTQATACDHYQDCLGFFKNPCEVLANGRGLQALAQRNSAIE